MDIAQWLTSALGGVLLATATWLACRWWYHRKLAALTLRLQKTEKARLFSVQQTLQARKQIEALQKTLALKQLQAEKQAQAEKLRTRQLEEVMKAAAEAEAQAYKRHAPTEGFADTQPMF